MRDPGGVCRTHALTCQHPENMTLATFTERVRVILGLARKRA